MYVEYIACIYLVLTYCLYVCSIFSARINLILPLSLAETVCLQKICKDIQWRILQENTIFYWDKCHPFKYLPSIL